MPNFLEDSDIDMVADQIDLEMTAEEEAQTLAQLAVSIADAPDLSDGGQIGEAYVIPMQGGVRQEKGRPTVRRAWSWNSTPTTLPLAWDNDGLEHDAARAYLRKRHCTCCKTSGFKGVQCPSCIKNNCGKCRNSTVRGNIIPCFYLREEEVPFPVNLFGDINCFLPFCVRQGDRGFKTQQDMIVHAETRHRLEWRAHLSSQQTDDKRELELLKEQIAVLMAAQLAGQASSEPNRKSPGRSPRQRTVKTPSKPRPNKQRVVSGTPERPLYISDKDKDKESSSV